MLYTVWYGIGRAWMEPLRDSAYNLRIFGMRVNMVLAIVAALAALAALLLIYLKKPARLMLIKDGDLQKEPEKAYESQFDYAMESEEDEKESNEEDKGIG